VSRNTVLWIGVGGRPATAPPDDVRVIHAGSGVDALKRLTTATVDCVVCPASLPDVGVVEFLGLLGEDHPDLPVVLVGDGDPDTVARAMDAGATAHVEAEALADRLREVLTRRRAETARAGHATLRTRCTAVAVAVGDAADRESAERAVQEGLAATGRYGHVWVGRYRDGTLHLGAPRSGRFDPDDVAALLGCEDGGFLERAVSDGDVAVTRSPAGTRTGGSPATGATGARGVRAAAVPLLEGGTVRGVLVLSADRADAFDGAERAALADLGSLVGHLLPAAGDAEASAPGTDLVHELRNPLGAALANLELARETTDSADLRRAAERLEELDHIVENVLRDGRIGDPERDRVDLGSVAEDAWSSLPDGEGELVLDVDGLAVEGDETLLDRLFENLFWNAVEHAGEEVTVGVGGLEEGFYVEDDGPGIPASDREHVFERGHTTADGGLGIGLAVVEQIAAAHDWSVTATESGAGGARFEVHGVESA
jgi:signal transduction histidine kinase